MFHPYYFFAPPNFHRRVDFFHPLCPPPLSCPGPRTFCNPSHVGSLLRQAARRFDFPLGRLRPPSLCSLAPLVLLVFFHRAPLFVLIHNHLHLPPQLCALDSAEGAPSLGLSVFLSFVLGILLSPRRGTRPGSGPPILHVPSLSAESLSEIPPGVFLSFCPGSSRSLP